MSQTLRALFRQLAELPDDKLAQAERLYVEELARGRADFDRLRKAPAWTTLDYTASRSHGFGLALGAHGTVGPFKLWELRHLAETLAIDKAGSYQDGLIQFYEGTKDDH